jgi:hypothetical protein
MTIYFLSSEIKTIQIQINRSSPFGGENGWIANGVNSSDVSLMISNLLQLVNTIKGVILNSYNIRSILLPM